MKVADAHVDVLMQLADRDVPFDGRSPLQAGLEALRVGGVTTQVFALFVPPRWPASVQLERVLHGIDLFYERVVATGEVSGVRNRMEYSATQASSSIAGLLSVEGAACLQGQPHLLRGLHRLGVRGMGLTWNDANDLADGCGEPRGGGLTAKGRAIIEEMGRLGMWIDIAHLADKGVEDVFALVSGPVMASHANARAVHSHRRNLTDVVIDEIVQRKGFLGLTFEGSFLNDESRASVEDVMRQLDHFLDCGALECVGFGSDFDGTSNPVPGLRSARDYAALTERIERTYGRDVAQRVCHANLERFLTDVLPTE